MIEFIAGLCFEIVERKSICSVSDGGVHRSICDDPDADKPEELCFVATISGCGNSEQGIRSIILQVYTFLFVTTNLWLGYYKGKSASFEYGIVSIIVGLFHWHPSWVQLKVT